MQWAFAVLICMPSKAMTRGAALAEPAATVVHALALAARAMAKHWQDTRALVLGAGAIGLMAALLLRTRGVAVLPVVETNPLRASAFHQATGLRCIESSVLANKQGSFDLVVDAVGVAATRELAIAAAAPARWWPMWAWATPVPQAPAPVSRAVGVDRTQR